MRFFFLSVIFILFSINFSLGQELSPQEEAIKLFNEKKYGEALTRFKKFVTLFPNDPKYKYFTGVCMVECNINLTDAIGYLTSASELAVPRDVYYYLGKAYHYQYKFEEALTNYQKFANFGIKKDQQILKNDLQIKMAHNGRNIYQYASVRVMEKESIDASAIYDYYNRLLNNGRFEMRPERGLAFGRSGKCWRYIPSLMPKSQAVYEANYTVINPNKDIFQVTKNENEKLSKPVNIGNIANSTEDDDFPFFNESESVLYFASKGFNSIGGYDIFKTRYDANTKTWSVPENMGYPINSPYDDYLFVPSDDQKFAYFASNRESKEGFVVIYKIEFSQKYQYKSLSSDFKFQNILDINSRNIPYTDKIPKEKTKEQTNNGPVNIELKNYPKELTEQKGYNDLLAKALQYQVKSDSVYRIVSEKKEKLINSNNEIEKNGLKFEIASLEKSAKQYQTQADVNYSLAREYEMQSMKKESDTPKFTDKIAQNAFSSESAKKEEFKNAGDSDKINGKHPKSTQKPPLVYEFKVMAKSPYKSADEIPINQPLPGGLIYRIQMGAFSNTIEPDRFKGIIPISGETVSNGKITKYYAGFFNRMTDAEKALNKVREYGFKDAYIVAFYDGKSIPSNRAEALEKMQ